MNGTIITSTSLISLIVCLSSLHSVLLLHACQCVPSELIKRAIRLETCCACVDGDGRTRLQDGGYKVTDSDEFVCLRVWVFMWLHV